MHGCASRATTQSRAVRTLERPAGSGGDLAMGLFQRTVGSSCMVRSQASGTTISRTPAIGDARGGDRFGDR